MDMVEQTLTEMYFPEVFEFFSDRVDFPINTDILNVGCGNRPTGDVNVDLFIHDSPHRRSVQESYSRDLNPAAIPNLVRADCHHLPFRDNTFKTVHCFDMIEHDGVEPARLIPELMRVCSKYVEFTVPSFWNWRQHPRRNPAHARLYRKRDITRLLWKWSSKVVPEQFESLTPFFPLPLVPSIYRVKVWKS